jgi:hypothetical protein
MNSHNHNSRFRRVNWTFWFIGLASLVWLLLRSGTKLRRLAYPCQRAALVSSLGFVGYLLSLLGTAHLYRRLKQGITPAGLVLFVLALLITSGLQSSIVLPRPAHANLTLSTWTSPGAVSDVFVVPDVPVPQCSLDGGALPSTPPCNDAASALHDDGVDMLIGLMESKGTYFYQTAAHPEGIVGPNDVVVVKINNQWGHMGYGNGVGRLVTNNDVLKGLIWRIVQHPEGFNGEVVVAENDQESGTDLNITPANAQDPNQSFQDAVDAFRSLGYPVSLYNWATLNYNLISGGSIGDSGYPSGEYAAGDTSDAYILLEDPAGAGTNELSYPKFQTANGNRVSMRYGVWDGSSYASDRLTFINLPVLKRHGMAGATIAWKNLIGFTTTFDTETRYGDWDQMHDFYWGYTEGANRDYGLLGRDIALIRAPDLHLVDAIWVGYEDNYDGDAIRRDVLLVSTDPFAVDWYASEYVLFPLTGGSQETSAARAGTFRSATRINQNVAEMVWPGGDYPYIDLLDDYDGAVPTDDERLQMNVYSTQASANEELTAEVVETEESETEEAAPVETSAEESAQPVLPPTEAGLIDDFEGIYEPDQAWEAWADDQTGDNVAVMLDNEITHSGSASLRMEFDIAPEGWVGFGRSFVPIQDWSEGLGLSMWLRFSETSQDNQGMSVTLYAGDPQAATPFEVWFEIPPENMAPSEWVRIELPWGRFARAEWADQGGLSEFDPAQVVGISFGFGAPDDSWLESSVWVDDLRLLSETPQPLPIEAAPTASPPATEAPVAVATATEASLAAAPTSPPAPVVQPEEGGESKGLCPISIGLTLAGMALVVRRGTRRPK